MKVINFSSAVQRNVILSETNNLWNKVFVCFNLYLFLEKNAHAKYLEDFYMRYFPLADSLFVYEIYRSM